LYWSAVKSFECPHPGEQDQLDGVAHWSTDPALELGVPQVGDRLELGLAGHLLQLRLVQATVKPDCQVSVVVPGS
jgi:hypothetical protein